ncbi:MAG: glycerol-3-phosphate acyltransferase [Candidatus Paceibacterota bacterium]
MFFYLILVYLLSSIPISFLLVKRTSEVDLRKVGSKKVSVSNVVKNAGVKSGLICLVFNLMKGFLAVYLTQHFGFNWQVQIAAGILVVAAQLWPLFFRFWGGTGFVVVIGALLFLAPKIALGAAVVRILVEVIINYYDLLPEGESMGITFALLLVSIWGFWSSLGLGIFGIATFGLVHLARILGIPGSLKEISSKKTLLLRLLYNQGVKRG